MTALTDTYWCMITVMAQALHISGSEVNQYSTDILALQTWQEYLAERRTRNSVERGGTRRNAKRTLYLRFSSFTKGLLAVSFCCQGQHYTAYEIVPLSSK